MSFLDSTNSEYLSARITKKGRRAIASGNFNIQFFQIGDSEYDYNFDVLSGNTNHQKILSPMDKEGGVKYPYGIDDNISTTYGDPVPVTNTETIRNVMGPAGFVSEHKPYGGGNDGPTVQCTTDTISVSQIDGSTSIDVTNGSLFNNCEFITIVIDEFGGTGDPVITDNATSLIYKITSIVGNTLNLDRALPNISSIGGNVEVVCNKCEIEYPSGATVNPIDPSSQLNGWTLNTIWTEKIIGSDVGGADESASGYQSNRYSSVKEMLGYTSTGQTFETLNGNVLDNPTSFKDSEGNNILIEPTEQRGIALIHYSQLGDSTNDPFRFFKYDDYISTKTGLIEQDVSLVDDRNGSPISDTEYFEVYLPWIWYHRSTGSTMGAVFTMDETDYYVRSIKNNNHGEIFRYLKDEIGVNVGKVFPNKKVIVFDDPELVAILDYRSNRRFTLPSPRISITPSNVNPPLFDGVNGSTYWVTYMMANSASSSSLNYLPCNYFHKLTTNDVSSDSCAITTPSNITVNFTNSDELQFLQSSLNNFGSGFLFQRFYILIQEVDNPTDLPSPNGWKIIDKTGTLGVDGVSFVSNSSVLVNKEITITRLEYETASFFDLETFMGSDYLLSDPSTSPQFGDEQPFSGSIRLVRATDIEELSYNINLPDSQFISTQNPTYNGGDKRVTEVALLNDKKEIMVNAKFVVPPKRVGFQVFSVRLDF